MSAALHSHDHEFAKIIEEGWKWLVIPWFVEARVVANLVYMHLRETTMKTFVVCPCTTDFRLLGK